MCEVTPKMPDVPEKQLAMMQVLYAEDVLENPRAKLGLADVESVSFDKLASWGVAFDPIVSIAQKITGTGTGKSGIYYVNTHGLEMFQSKTGNAYVASLKGKNGAVGGGQALISSLPCNPTMLCMAASLAAIEKKLDKIQEQQTEIFDFLQAKEESEVFGDFQTLADVLENYKYNSNNQTYKANKHILVQDIRKDSERKIAFYQSLVQKDLEKKTISRSDQELKKAAKQLQKNLQNYQLALYLWAYSAFLEALLLENFNQEYLNHISSQIRDEDFKYRNLYTFCYDKVAGTSENTLQTRVTNALSAASIGVGTALSKNPILRKTPVDEGLLHIGQKMRNASENKTAQLVHSLIGSSDSGTSVFAENIDRLNIIWNSPQEVLFDKRGIYFVPHAG